MTWPVCKLANQEYHHHHHNISFMELDHLLTRSGLTYPEVSSKVYHDSFCHLGSSTSLICFQEFHLYVVSSFSCIPVICPKLVLFLTTLQFVHLFCNPSKCILLFSCIQTVTHPCPRGVTSLPLMTVRICTLKTQPSDVVLVHQQYELL